MEDWVSKILVAAEKSADDPLGIGSPRSGGRGEDGRDFCDKNYRRKGRQVMGVNMRNLDEMRTLGEDGLVCHYFERARII